MKQKEQEKAGELTVERNDKGEVMMPRYDCVSGHKTQKTFMDYIKLSSDEIVDNIDAIANSGKTEVYFYQ